MFSTRVLFLLLFFSHSVVAAENIDLNDKSKYAVVDLSNRLFLVFKVDRRGMSFSVFPKDGGDNTGGYAPNDGIFYSIGISYKSFGISVAAPSSTRTRNEKKYGKTTMLDIRLSQVLDQFWLGLYHLRYKGFHLTDFKSGKIDERLAPDLTVKLTEFRMAYLLWNHDLSLHSIYDFSEVQKRFGWSLLLEGDFGRMSFSNPEPLLSSYDSDESLGVSEGTFDFGIAMAGAGFIYPFFNGFFFSGLGGAGFGSMYSNIKVGDKKESATKIASKLKLLFTLGYNANKFAFGIATDVSALSGFLDQHSMVYGIGSNEAFVGYRF